MKNLSPDLVEAYDKLIQLHNWVQAIDPGHRHAFQLYADLAKMLGIEPLLRQRQAPSPIDTRFPPPEIKPFTAALMPLYLRQLDDRFQEQMNQQSLAAASYERAAERARELVNEESLDAECARIAELVRGRVNKNFLDRLTPAVPPLVRYLTGKDIVDFFRANDKVEIARWTGPDDKEKVSCSPAPRPSLTDAWFSFPDLLERWHLADDHARDVPSKYNLPIYLYDRSGEMRLIRHPVPSYREPEASNIWLSVPTLWCVHRSHVEFLEKRDPALAEIVGRVTPEWLTGQLIQKLLRCTPSEFDALLRDGKLKPWRLNIETGDRPEDAFEQFALNPANIFGEQPENAMFKLREAKKFSAAMKKSLERLGDEEWIGLYYDRRKRKNPDITYPKVIDGIRSDFSGDRKEQDKFNARWSDNQLEIVIRDHARLPVGRPPKANPKKRKR